MGSPEHKQKIWNLIKGIGTGMLVTEDDGRLRSRPMQLVQDDYDGTLWFFTRTNSPKADEVLEEQNVCIDFCDPKNKTFVSLSGQGTVTWDQELKNKFWSPMVGVWFPEGKDDNSCALLEIKIEHGEHWDSDVTALGFAYEMVKASFTGTTPDISNNSKF